MLILINVLLLATFTFLFLYRIQLEITEPNGGLLDFILWFYGWAPFLIVYDFHVLTPVCFALVSLASYRVWFVKNTKKITARRELNRILSSARKILKRREVSPITLEELKKSFSVWEESEKEYVRLLAIRNEWGKKVEGVNRDITRLEDEAKNISDPFVRSSYDSLVVMLNTEKEELEKMAKEADEIFSRAKGKRQKLLDTFTNAIDLANSYKKYDASRYDIMEHQKEIKHLLEKTHSDGLK